MKNVCVVCLGLLMLPLAACNSAKQLGSGAAGVVQGGTGVVRDGFGYVSDGAGWVQRKLAPNQKGQEQQSGEQQQAASQQQADPAAAADACRQAEGNNPWVTKAIYDLTATDPTGQKWPALMTRSGFDSAQQNMVMQFYQSCWQR